MKSKEEIEKFAETKSYKTFEKTLGIKIRNGQSGIAIRKTLAWVLSDLNCLPTANKVNPDDIL